MYRLPKQVDEGAPLASPRSSRAPSICSDLVSTAGSTSTIAAFYVPSAAFQPPPAYVAVSAASQIVTDHQNATLLDQLTAEEADNVPAESARLSEDALGLLNGFLDSLLFSILASSRSRSMMTIRPAVQEVLKTRLAREAIRAADEELSGLLAGGEEEDEELPNGHGEKWSLDAVFKRTRLRIMVYTRLGELEDEDEERVLEEDGSYPVDEAARDADLVSWAAAIFLTSVIEYIAEQTLIVAGQAAFKRVRAKRKRSIAQANDQDELEEIERVIVNDFDMEKVALNSALGRLWRTWKKTNRAPITPITSSGRFPLNRALSSGSIQRRYSTGNAHDAPSAAALAEVPEVEYSEHDMASNIPLPIGGNDVEEIEVPGIAETFEEADENATPVPSQNKKQRPMSWLAAPGSGRHLIRTRSNSMPTLKQIAQRHASATSSEEAMGTPPFETPAEFPHQREDYMAEAEQTPEPKQSPGTEEKNRVSMARSSMYDDVSSVIAETGSLRGAASPPPAPPVNRRSILRDRSPRPLQLGRDILANGRSTGASRANRPLVENKIEIRPKKSRSNSPQKENRSVKPTTSNEAMALAKAADAAKARPLAAAEEAAQKEGRHANHLPPGGRIQVGPSAEVPFAADLAPKDGSLPGSTSPKQAPPTELGKELDPANHRMSRALRSQTVSTQASQTVPQGPLSVSAFSSPTRDSSTSRRSHDSTRSQVRGRAANAEISVERAGLQRVSSISSAGTSILHISRGSESSIPTVTPTATSRPAAAPRRSEDNRALDFDAAIAQNETVFYTLTPQRMREVSREREKNKEARDQSSHARSATATQVSVFPRGPHSGSGSSQQLHRSNSSSRGSMSSKQGKSTISDDSAKDSRAARPTPINQVGNTYTRNKYMPREPRVQTDPTFDLRDFLISTTPTSNNKPIAPLDTSFTRSADNSPATTTPTSVKGLLAKTGSRSAKNSISEGSSHSLATRRKLEARSPAGPVHVDNDLIDLIRQGPPGSDHRIPRTVAPFRNTMDSEQMELYSNNNIAPSRGGLGQGHTVQPAYGNGPSTLAGSFSDGPAITKNRPKKRVIDPYAIPDDDDLEAEFGEEDEDELTALPGSTGGPVSTPPIGGPAGDHSSNATASQESTVSHHKAKSATSDLADFLSNEPPSTAVTEAPVQPFKLPESTIEAIKSGGGATAASANGIRSVSAPQHGKNGSNPGAAGGMGFSASSSTYTTQISGGSGNHPRRLDSSASNTSFGSGAGSMGGPMAKRSNTMRHHQNPGARDARMDREEERGGLSEMADFLKNSGPPPMMVRDEKPMPFVKIGKDGNPIDPTEKKEKKGGFARFFKR